MTINHFPDTQSKVWLDSLAVELRLLDVSGASIGDAVASVREFLADSGSDAELSFGSPQHYAASLQLPVRAKARATLNGVVVRSVLGVVGLMGLTQSVVPLVHGNNVGIMPGVLVIVLGVIAVVTLLPRLLPTMTRLRRRGWTMVIVVGGILGGTVPVVLSLGAGSRALVTIPALPLALISALLLLGPALWSQRHHSFMDDPIVEPGSGTTEDHSRLMVAVTNWIMVIGAVIVCVLSLLLDQVVS